jgi:hypothetical protein
MGCSNPLYYKGQLLADLDPEADVLDDAALGSSAVLGPKKYRWDQDALSQIGNDREGAETAASELADTTADAELGFFGGGGGGGDDSHKKFGYGLKVPGLNDYTCGTKDPYGDAPTVIKVAIYIRLTASFGETPAVAFMLVIRNFYIARLIFMTLSGPPDDALLMMRPILDLFSARKLDVSLNTNPFPVKMYSGTIIQARPTPYTLNPGA